MLPYDTDALASTLGHNSGTEKVVRTKCSIVVPVPKAFDVQSLYLSKDLVQSLFLSKDLVQSM
jgi:hypothetical protein